VADTAGTGIMGRGGRRVIECYVIGLGGLLKKDTSIIESADCCRTEKGENGWGGERKWRRGHKSFEYADDCKQKILHSLERTGIIEFSKLTKKS